MPLLEERGGHLRVLADLDVLAGRRQVETVTEEDVGGIFSGFEGYRTPSDEDLARVLRGGIVAFDTNVLLDLYRYGDAARIEFLSVLETIQGALFVPAQVLTEFWRNRDGVLDEVVASGSKQPLASPRATIRSVVNEWGKRTQELDQVMSFLNEAEKVLDEIEQGMRRASGRLDGEGALLDTAGDPVLIGLDRLLVGRTGVPLENAERAALIEAGNLRFQAEVPPGYLDAAKYGLTEAGTGDYLIWEELISRAAATNLDVLFVTRDEKPDWWRKNKDYRFLGPRVELVAEMLNRSGVNYMMLRPPDFLKAATDLLNVAVSDRTIEDASRIGLEDQGKGDDAWSERTVELLLHKLEVYGAWVQAGVIKEAASHPDGFVTRAHVFDLAGFAEGRQLKGFTRPVRGVVDDLIAEGEISEDIDFPLVAVYAGPGKAEGFQVAQSIVEALTREDGPGRMTWIEAAIEVMKGSSEWWHLRDILLAIVERRLRDTSDAKTPEATLRRDLTYRASTKFERDGTMFRLIGD